MKSQPQGINGSCKNCSFASLEDGEQIGCKAGRLEKFKKLDLVKEKNENFFTISRFCNMLRLEEQSVEDARKQISLKFGIVILDEDEKFSSIAIESCKNINYNNEKIHICLFSKYQSRFGRLFSVVHEYKDLKIKCDLVLQLDENEEKKITEKNIFQKLIGCSYVLVLKSTDLINPNFFQYIDKSINDDLDNILIYEVDNLTCIQFYMLNNIYLEFDDYNQSVLFAKEQAIKNLMYKKYEE